MVDLVYGMVIFRETPRLVKYSSIWPELSIYSKRNFYPWNFQGKPFGLVFQIPLVKKRPGKSKVLEAHPICEACEASVWGGGSFFRERQGLVKFS